MKATPTKTAAPERAAEMTVAPEDPMALASSSSSWSSWSSWSSCSSDAMMKDTIKIDVDITCEEEDE